ncbi:MAG: hypothetical protein JXB15_15960 [Anaerolineales bacterium]|nr:hypothetical protein [Anaerolineales bacterium]
MLFGLGWFLSNRNHSAPVQRMHAAGHGSSGSRDYNAAGDQNSNRYPRSYVYIHARADSLPR